jgi:hypothetical protein
VVVIVIVGSTVALGSAVPVTAEVAVLLEAPVARLVGTSSSWAVEVGVPVEVGVSVAVGMLVAAIGVGVLVITAVDGSVMPSSPAGRMSSSSKASLALWLTSVSANVTPTVVVIAAGCSIPAALTVICSL